MRARNNSTECYATTRCTETNGNSEYIGDEENVHPNGLPLRCKTTYQKRKRGPTSGDRKKTTNNFIPANINNNEQSIPWTLKQATTHNVIFAILITALIISVVISCYTVSVLSDMDSYSPVAPIKSDIPMTEGRNSDKITANQDALACVRNIGNKCELYPCINDSGVFVEITTPESPFGYAGRFVHRDVDLKSQKPLMKTIGDKGWGSGCVVSDEYKFVYIHVLKSGGTATKEFLRKALCGEDDKDCERVDPHILRPHGCKGAMLNYSDYFTFSFVRNPFSRTYSMYSMMDGFPIEPGQKVTDVFSFHDFVINPEEREQYTIMHAGHYDHQTSFILSKDKCPSFDFLGRVEHYDEDMRTILNHIKATKLLQYLDSIGGSVHVRNSFVSLV